MNFKKKNITVTGASGSLGKAICKKLHAAGYSVTGIYRTTPSEQVQWNIALMQVNSTYFEQLLSTTEVLIHAAAEIPGNNYNDEECYNINQNLDRIVYDIAQKVGLPEVIFISSTSVYGFDSELKTESSKLNPTSLYSIGKVMSEKLFLSLQAKKNIILRINAPYNPEDMKDTVLRKFIKSALAGEDIFYFGSGSRKQDFTYVHDIADFILQIVGYKERLKEIYNISGANPITMKNLAELIVSVIPDCQSQIRPLDVSDKEELYAANFSIEKARKNHNWYPKMPLRDGILECINFLR